MNGLMRAQQLSGAELGRVANIHEKTIYKYADGKVDNPRGDTMHRIAKALGVSEQFLRHGDTAQSQQNIETIKRQIKKVGELGVWVDSARSITSDNSVSQSTAYAPVEGSSLSEKGIKISDNHCDRIAAPGDTLIYEPIEPHDTGKIANNSMVVVERHRDELRETTVRRLRVLPTGTVLELESRSLVAERLSPSATVLIVGVVTGRYTPL